MRRHIRGVDHVIVLVRDLDRAQEAWQRMGFTLTPRGFHSLGSQNHCVMFGRDYIELMALPRPHPSLRYFSDFLAVGEGLGGLVLATDDAAGAHAEFARAGIVADPPLALSRPVDGLGDARFSLLQLPESLVPGFRLLACQHHTRELVWRPEYQSHALGALEIAGLAVYADSTPAYADPLGASVRDTPEGDILATGSTPILISTPEKLRPRMGKTRMPARPAPAVAALFIRVGDREQAEDALRRGGFAPAKLRDGSLAVGADQANGVALIFG